MPFEFEYRKAGTTPPLGDTNHADGYVVFETTSNKEYATYTTEAEAQRTCEELNRKEQAGELE
ncbi:hypothetical protein [Phytohalomonas tamaricis]|uniref:hypothetical protein n=1 Tax=Phytohalomonas tamaricis TaxID=2081032 RepID=UPI000D0BC919|nr:hypothetical protein [Phytohalomonas tamaricis]